VRSGEPGHRVGKAGSQAGRAGKKEKTGGFERNRENWELMFLGLEAE
jgi:hypothetical protein